MNAAHRRTVEFTDGSVADVVVDSNACVGSGVCNEIAGGMFILDDDGTAHIQAPADAPARGDIELAVDACPSAAIHIAASSGGTNDDR